MLADPNVDILFAPITGVFPGMSDALAQDLVELHDGTAASRSSRRGCRRFATTPAYRSLCEAGVPLFHSFGGGGPRDQARSGRYSAFARELHAARSRAVSDARRRGRELAACRAVLLRRAARPGSTRWRRSSCSRRTGSRPSAERVATSGGRRGSAAAAQLGLPVVMKILSPDIAHKSDLGLVEVGVAYEPRRPRRRIAGLIERAAQVGAGRGGRRRGRPGDGRRTRWPR